MATKAVMTPEQYLRTSFEGPDREYVSGELHERTMADEKHSAIQVRFVEIVYEQKKRGVRIFARTELRMRLDKQTYRVPDVAIFEGQSLAAPFPAEPPLAVVEILSPNDPFQATARKLHEYHHWGVPHIWLVSPDDRILTVFAGDTYREVESFDIPKFQIKIPKSEIFQ